VSVGPPAFTPFIVPLALVLVLLTGVGPMISWRRATVANLRRNFIFPVSFGVIVLIAVLIGTDAGRKPFAVAMFGLGAFVIASVFQEIYRGTAARRAITHDAWPVALVALIRRNRRRYGGYIVHLGVSVLLIGVAASSSFQHSRDVTLRPGQSAMVDGYRFLYNKPIASAAAEKVSFGAQIIVSKRGHHVVTVNTSRGFYPSTNISDGIIGRFFDSANADSTVGLDAGPLRDIWTVVNSNPTHLSKVINQGNRVFANLLSSILKQTKGMSPAQQDAAIARVGFWTARDKAVAGIVSQYVSHPWPVQFLLIVSPLVTWIWAGALIIGFGGLIALWPAPVLVRRRSPAVVSEPLARELV
jgi:cytochrome c-type biogenesis protein CcmF